MTHALMKHMEKKECLWYPLPTPTTSLGTYSFPFEMDVPLSRCASIPSLLLLLYERFLYAEDDCNDL